jgi:ubiquinone/menaquinone biosynthesis C-methylase UbiE
METNAARKHWISRADPEKEPSPWWYFARAVYVSRYDYKRIFFAFLAFGVPMAVLGVFFFRPLLYAAFFMAGVGLLLLIYSLIGLYRQYGHPAEQYFRSLVEWAGVADAAAVADLQIGTYRHAYRLAQVLPNATIYSVDCWNVEGPPPEKAIADVRDLEPPPASHPQIRPLKAKDFSLPLPDGSCDAVVFGFGTHEIPTGGPREKLFGEAQRIVKPGGKVLLFEHGYDFHNYLIFGPVIGHVTRRADWLTLLKKLFDDVRYKRTSHAVDLFVGTRRS